MDNLKFSHDKAGHEVLLKGRHQVMMEWEKPYMHACIDFLKPTSHDEVLEVGFGCGYASHQIQSYKPKSHTIIECSPEVLKKARAFAKDHPGVKIIEGTWQEQLKKLGKFDVVFLDDYPLETDAEIDAIVKKEEGALHILEEGKEKMRHIEKQFPSLKKMVYSNSDLDALFQTIQNERHDGRFLYRFFVDLASSGQISQSQCEHMIDRLLKAKRILPEEIHKEKKIEKVDFSKIHVGGDRLFDFLEVCLKDHMRKGARFSCYLNSSRSRYEDRHFFEKIISNPYLEFVEKKIPVNVPEHCTYYKDKEALVIKVTKVEDPKA